MGCRLTIIQAPVARREQPAVYAQRHKQRHERHAAGDGALDLHLLLGGKGSRRATRQWIVELVHWLFFFALEIVCCRTLVLECSSVGVRQEEGDEWGRDANLWHGRAMG